jgi:enolase-phosphatase E1
MLLDIEGTTTPISFVTEVLFPYARRNGRKFILKHLQDKEIQTALLQIQADNASDHAAGAPAIQENNPIEDTIRYYLWLIDVDRKSTALKTIQGRIWEEGYARGELRSTIFPDVHTALERWKQQGRITAIYSSGSVLAQQHLFSHTQHGDLTPFISAYFDTRIGGKKESGSYTRITEQLKLAAHEILFVSDAIEELDAARTAGMNTALSVRPGNTPTQEHTEHAAIHSFEELP